MELRNTFSVTPWTHNHGNGSGHPTTQIKVEFDPTAIPVNGIRRMVARCECGATQKVIPLKRKRR